MPLYFKKTLKVVKSETWNYLLPLYAEERNFSKTKQKDLDPH